MVRDEEKYKKYQREYQLKHKGKTVEHKEVSCIICGDKFVQKNKNHKVCNKKNCKRERGHRYWRKMYHHGGLREKDSLFHKKRYEKNPEHYRKLSNERYLKNKDKKKAYVLEYIKNKYRTNESFRIRMNLTNSLRDVIRNYIKTGKIVRRLEKYGIDWEGIIKQLSPIPKDRRKYNVDHIIPLYKFDLTDIEQIQLAFAPENHRWLTKEKNQSRDRPNTKGRKYKID